MKRIVFLTLALLIATPAWAGLCRVDVYENSTRLRTSIPVKVPYQFYPVLEVAVPDVGPEDTVQIHAQSQVTAPTGTATYSTRVMIAWFIMRSEAPRSPLVSIPLDHQVPILAPRTGTNIMPGQHHYPFQATGTDAPDPDRAPQTYWYEFVPYAAVSPTFVGTLSVDYSPGLPNYNRITATVWRGGC